MDYEQRQNIEKELVKNYPNLQNAFYNGKLSSEKLTNYVTQPFWHSLNHSKRSLDRKGARIDVECVGRISPPRLKTKATDEAVQVREYHQKVLERKKVYVNEQCVYKKKDRKLYNTSVIDIKTNENEVVCPSCGARGLASSFIDGCDFCNTKFVINKSVNKISSFASQENTRSKVVRVFVKLIDDIKTMDEVCDNTKLMESKQFDIIRMNKYESDYVQNDVASYISYLWTLDFDEVEYPERGTKEYDNVIRLERRHYFDYMYLRSELETQVVIIEYNDNGNEINVIFDAE